MQRTDQHIIDEEACSAFDRCLPRSEFTVRVNPKPDYGIDAEIELFKEGRTTGRIYKVQIKGTRHPKYSQRGESVAVQLRVVQAAYLLEEVEIPTVLVLCDVSDRSAPKVFWSSLRSNRVVRTRLRRARDKGSQFLTVPIPVSQKLPESLEQMLAGLHHDANFIAFARVTRASPAEYFRYVASTDSLEQLAHLKTKLDVANYSQLQELLMTRDVLRAKQLIEQILESPESSQVAKFHALLRAEQAFIIERGPSAIEGDTLIRFYGEWVPRIRVYATGDPNLESIANGYELIGELMHLSAQYTAIAVSRGRAPGPPTNLFEYELALLQARISLDLIERVDGLWQLAQPLAASEAWAFLPALLIRGLHEVVPLVNWLRNQGLDRPSFLLKQWVRSMNSIASGLAKQIPELQFDLLGCAQIELFLAKRKDPEDIERQHARAKEIVSGIDDPEVRQSAVAELQEAKNAMEGISEWDDDHPDWEGARRIAKAVAFGHGIDVELAKVPPGASPTEDIRRALLVRNGIADIDPTQDLVDCAHMSYRVRRDEELCRLIGIESIGEKSVECILHLEHPSVDGARIHEATAAFKGKYCRECCDRTPHPEGWIYTRPWWHSQIRKLYDRLKPQKHQ